MKMQNSSIAEAPRNPKLEMLMSLRRLCYSDFAVNYSWVLQGQGVNYNDSWCPRTFDGFACWDETPAGATAAQPCPGLVIGFDTRRLAYKTCTENGTWYLNPSAGRPWTNYTTCIDLEDLQFRGAVNTIYVVGYAVSVAALLLSMAIFLYFRNLQCMRVRIHMHLFTSFALNSLAWIAWYQAVVSDVVVVQENRVWCQALHVLSSYFMVTSYMWMFCEGLHLHIALVVVFVKEEAALRWFVALGWGAPVLIVATYAAVRHSLPAATDQCWMNHSDAFWIIIVPVLLSLVASFVFLANVVRVLVTKLHPAVSSHVSLATKKAVRAALILVPLFGLHFMLLPLRPAPDSPLERSYQVFSALLTSLQGLCVAVLFCFTNHDVVQAAHMQLVRYRRATDAVAITGMTAGESIAHTRDII